MKYKECTKLQPEHEFITGNYKLYTAILFLPCLLVTRLLLQGTNLPVDDTWRLIVSFTSRDLFDRSPLYPMLYSVDIVFVSDLILWVIKDRIMNKWGGGRAISRRSQEHAARFSPELVLSLCLSCTSETRPGADTCEPEIQLVMMILLCLLFCIYVCCFVFMSVMIAMLLWCRCRSSACSVVHTVPLTVPISNIINNDDVVLFVVLYLLW